MPARRLPPPHVPDTTVPNEADGGAGSVALPSSPAIRSLMRVTVVIPATAEGEVVRRFDEDLSIQAAITPDIESLNDALSTNPARYGEWAMLEELARAQHDEIMGNLGSLDSDIKDLEAAIYLEVLDNPTSAGGKTLTVDGIKARVQTDPRRLALVGQRKDLDAAAREAKAAMKKLGVGKDTIEQKKDSLLALSSNWRQEMQTKLTVAAHQLRPTR